MQPIESFLGSLPLFKGFSETNLRQLLESSRRMSYAPEEPIIRFGQPGRFLGVALAGQAEAVVTTRTGERVRLGLVSPGDCLGEMSLLTGEPTSADVVALERCEVLLIPQEAFHTLLATNPGVVRVLARTITERLRHRHQDEEAVERVEEAWRNTPDPYGLDLATTTPAKILVVNCGSSSLKFSLFDTDQASNNVDGLVDRIGVGSARLSATSARGRTALELGAIDYGDAFRAMMELLTDPARGVLRSPGELTAVGHRVVHGGSKYSSPVLLDDQVMEEIERLSSLAPLHNPLNLLAIKASSALMPGVPQVAVFDTAFHQRMPQHAYLYGLPYDLYEAGGIRRYGFHGISHNYVALRAAAHLKRDLRELKLITCHLGNGSSVCAIDHGRSVDTSMGFTPLEGLVMGTRCGDLDPSIVLHLCRDQGLSIQQVDELLNRKSGLKGLSGLSSDFRTLAEAANQGDPRALLTIHVFCYRIRKYIGSYIAALGGLDALVFTGGIGENSAWVRALACHGLPYVGIQVDDLANKTAAPRPGEATDVAGEGSRVRVLVVPTDEGRMIARETLRTLGYERVARVMEAQQEKRIPIEVSAHHVHLSKRAVEALFGVGYQLTRRAELSQPGQYACEETVNLVGPHGRVDRVRVLGPTRSQCQVEISMTEEFKLGIKAPVRASGDLDGSPGLTLEGGAGRLDLAQGVICALRHIHMDPEDALRFGVKDRYVVMVKVPGDRELIFGDVLVRVDPDYRLTMHIDTDEANAGNLTSGIEGQLVGVQDRR